jgi:hypothetical protein
MKNRYIIWVNYNNSLTWIKAILGWFPLLTMTPVRSQWGRYNLPRYNVVLHQLCVCCDYMTIRFFQLLSIYPLVN